MKMRCLPFPFYASIFSRRRGGRENKSRDFWIITVIIILYKCPLNIPLFLQWFHFVLVLFLCERPVKMNAPRDDIFIPCTTEIENNRKRIFTNTIYEGIHAHTFTKPNSFFHSRACFSFSHSLSFVFLLCFFGMALLASGRFGLTLSFYF